MKKKESFKLLLSSLKKRPELQKAFKAIAYLGSESVLRIIIGFFIHTWIARYLGPERFGEMNYIRQLVVFFVLASALGLDDIYFRKLVEGINSTEQIVSDVFWLRALSSCIFYLIFLLVAFIQFSEERIFVFIALYGCSVLFLPFISFETVFLSQLRNRGVFVSRITGYGAGNIAKVLSVIFKLGMPFILISYLVEELISRLIVSVKYFKRYSLHKIRLLNKFQKEIFIESLPLLLIGIVAFADARIGLYFLKNYSTENELGFFSVSSTLIDLWYFLPGIISTSLFPKLIQSKQLSMEVLDKRIQHVFDVCVWLGIGLFMSVLILGDIIIDVLYGSEFKGAANIIRIASFGAIFGFFGIPRGKYLIIQNQHKTLGLFVGALFILNIISLTYLKDHLNSKVIIFCGIGTFLIVNMFFSIINSEIRKTSFMFLKSLVFPLRLIIRFC